ncbi:MAG: DUF6206 family protein [bacterium]
MSEPSLAGPPAPGSEPLLDDAELGRLHETVEAALRARSEESLDVVGWGEISIGVGWPRGANRVVAKRMPGLGSRAAFDAYAPLLGRYREALERAGIATLRTDVRAVDVAGGGVVAYALQPLLSADALGPAVLRASDPGEGHPIIEALARLAAQALSTSVGIDAQIANWGWVAGAPVYFDVTTPLMRDAAGADEMDFDLLLSAYPWALRGLLRRFVAPGIVDTYFDLRRIYLDLCGNLIKERLEGWLEPVLASCNRHLRPPLTADVVARYYRSDARLWAFVQRIRRADRAWHRLRRRTYPYLIPGEIQR